jgi:hypothetical protein
MPGRKMLVIFPGAVSCLLRKSVSRASDRPRFGSGFVYELLIEGVAGAAHRADRVRFIAENKRVAQPPEMYIHSTLVDARRSDVSIQPSRWLLGSRWHLDR